MFSQAARPDTRQIYFLRLHKLPKPDQTKRKRIRKLYILEGCIILAPKAFDLNGHRCPVEFRVEPRHKIIAI